MRPVSICLLAVLLVPFSGFSQRTHPSPPGLVEARKDSERFRAALDEKLPSAKRPAIEPAKLQAEAGELSRLAAALPGQFEEVNRGQLPKDLSDNLKRIEKLAHKLRSEISSQ